MVSPAVQIIPPNYKLKLVDKEGILTTSGIQFLQQMWAQIVNTNSMTPTTSVHTSNAYALTVFPVPSAGAPTRYADYSVFTFVADFTSTGSVTANVNSLGSVKVFKSNGASQAGAGDIVLGSLYLLIYNSALDSGNGGLVLK